MKIERAFIARDMNAIQNAFDVAADLADIAFVENTDAAYLRAADLSLSLFDLAEKHLTVAEIDTIDFDGAPLAELHARRAAHVADMEARAARSNDYTFCGF
mgnify:CR=1 FL=1